MRFHETREGEYRIFVGALESTKGGWTAALIVRRDAAGRPQEAFRDDSLACGYRWNSAEDAIQYAVMRGREMVRSRSPMLAC